jgi:hypothetical protein
LAGAAQPQGLVAGEARQQVCGQPQIHPFQPAYPGQGGVLDKPLLNQAQAERERCPGGAAAEQPARVGAEASGGIDGQQQMGLPLVALGQQRLDGGSRCPLLAIAEEGIDPEAGFAGIGRLLKAGDPQPAGVVPVPFGERLAWIKGRPEPHGHAGQMQFAGHHQAVSAVVAWTHQHHGAPLVQGCAQPGGRFPFGGQCPQVEDAAGEGQPRLLHQGLHRQAAGKELRLQIDHLLGRHQ